MTGRIWHLLTGEYPPQSGGISDYTWLLAAGLAAGDEQVHVWTTPVEGITSAAQEGVMVHHSAGKWSPRDLARLGAELDSFAAPRRLLVQHTPNTWGYRGLNLRFCEWLVKRKKAGDDIWLMVHEPFYPWLWRDKPTRWLLAAGQRWMLRRLLSASSRVYISIPGWEKHLRAYETVGRRMIEWLPIFSTIPVIADDRKVAELRQGLTRSGRIVIGNFGTFGGAIGEMLLQVLPALLLSHPERVGLLLGRGGERFAARLLSHHPQLSERLFAPGELSPEQVSLNLQACDVLVQPYPDGVSSRRTSVMAGLAHGIPTVSNTGFLSEPIWAQTNCVALAATHKSSELVAEVEILLKDSDARASLAARADAVYTQNFALEHTLSRLRDAG